MMRVKSNLHYLLIFGVTLLVGYLLVGIAQTFVDLKLTGVRAAIPMISAMYAGMSFLKHEQRLPTNPEKNNLSNLSFLILIAMNGVFLILAKLTGAFAEAFPPLDGPGRVDFPWGLIIGVSLFILVINYLMIRFGYGYILRKQAEHMGLK